MIAKLIPHFPYKVEGFIICLIIFFSLHLEFFLNFSNNFRNFAVGNVGKIPKLKWRKVENKGLFVLNIKH
jgi:hypothetical protein